IELEISVLTPMKEIQSIDEITLYKGILASNCPIHPLSLPSLECRVTNAPVGV
ncbi:unnamed protein product, partial [marine sediment metagenome]